MKTDIELLELAAKASEIKYDAEASQPHPKSGAFWGLWLVIDGEPNELQKRYWNPLRDDGDALRLAVKLGLKTSVGYDVGLVFCRPTESDEHEVWEPLGKNDPYAATRRAIVRAAADIGAQA